jgi:hypothetical protein
MEVGRGVPVAMSIILATWEAEIRIEVSRPKK